MNKRIGLFAAGLAIAFFLGAITSEAEAADLKGMGAFTTGSQSLKIDGLGRDSDFMGIEVAFDEDDFTAITNQGVTLRGDYKLKGKKITFDFSKTSEKKIEKALKKWAKEMIIDEFGGLPDDFDVDIERIKVKGKIKNGILTIKGKIVGEGEADGEKADGTMRFKTSGQLFEF